MPAKLISVNITLGPAAAKSPTSTLAKLKHAGLRDANLLEGIGIVTGRVAKEKLGDVKKVHGISVEMDETVQIPPPDAPIK